MIRVLSDEKKESYRYGFITKEPISEAAEKDRSIFVCGSQGINDYIEKQTGELGTAKKDVALTRMAGCERPQQDPVISI